MDLGWQRGKRGHGANKTGVWTTAALGTLDWATNSIGEANIWVSGYNGHANSLLGGGGRGAAASPESYARNIFTRTKRGTATAAESGSPHPLVDMGVFTSVTTRGYTYRGSMGYNWTPTAGSNTTAFRAFAWGTPAAGASGRTAGAIWSTGSQAVTMDVSPGTEAANYDAQANYHTFTCSKCHNPPRLLVERGNARLCAWCRCAEVAVDPDSGQLMPLAKYAYRENRVTFAVFRSLQVLRGWTARISFLDPDHVTMRVGAPFGPPVP